MRGCGNAGMRYGLGMLMHPEAVPHLRIPASPHHRTNIGYGFTGIPFHHTFTSFDRAMAK